MTEETPDERMRRLLTGRFQKQLPRKFYTSVQLTDANAILLDGKPVKTPMKNALVLKTRALADAVAAEWTAQVKVIDPETMPLTKLANTALDRATAERAHVLQEITEYAGSDLVCYWADRPPELVQLQRKHWQPVLNWADTELSAKFTTAISITHIAQDPSKSCRSAKTCRNAGRLATHGQLFADDTDRLRTLGPHATSAGCFRRIHLGCRTCG